MGDAVAIGGSAYVDGKVTGDVAVIGGTATLDDDAEVFGNVVSVGGQVEIDERSNVHGEVIEVPFGPNFRFNGWPRPSAWPGAWDWNRHGWYDFSVWGHFFGLIWRFFGLVLLGLLACLAWLLARGPVERIGHRIATEPWKSGLAGLVAQILFLPLLVLVVLILVVSIIGIPLLLLVPFALVALCLIAFLGYVAVAHHIGRWLADRFGWSLSSPYVVVLAGLACLQALSFFGAALDLGGGPIRLFAVMFLVFGFCVKYVAWTLGLGGAILTRFGTSATWERGGSAPPPPAPAEPSTSPSAPEAFEASPAAGGATADGRPFWERETLEEGGEPQPEEEEPKT
jgi:hypothetical protein